MNAKLTKEFEFAGFSFPRYIANLPTGSLQSRLERYKADSTVFTGGYYIKPSSEPSKTYSYYLEDKATTPGMRWCYCNDIPNDWDEDLYSQVIDHEGWYSNNYQDETVEGIVLKLNRGRGYLAGWTMGEGMLSEVEIDDIYDNVKDAARRADSLAQDVSEREREYQERSDQLQDCKELEEQVIESKERIKELVTERYTCKNTDGYSQTVHELFKTEIAGLRQFIRDCKETIKEKYDEYDLAEFQ